MAVSALLKKAASCGQSSDMVPEGQVNIMVTRPQRGPSVYMRTHLYLLWRSQLKGGKQNDGNERANPGEYYGFVNQVTRKPRENPNFDSRYEFGKVVDEVKAGLTTQRAAANERGDRLHSNLSTKKGALCGKHSMHMDHQQWRSGSNSSTKDPAKPISIPENELNVQQGQQG